MPRGGVSGFSPEALRRAMQRAEVSAEELATLIGLTRQAVQKWLRGDSSPAPRSLPRIAEALGVDPAQLTPGATAAPRLSDLRVRAGLSQVETAERLGIGATTLRGLEAGTHRELSPELADAIADLYSVTAEEVAGAHAASLETRAKWASARITARRNRN